MNQRNLFQNIFVIILIVFLVVACGEAKVPAANPKPSHAGEVNAPVVNPEPSPTEETKTPVVNSEPSPSGGENAPVVTPGPNPSTRSFSSMAYDSESDRVILFGGFTGDIDSEGTINDETWAYDPSNYVWVELAPASSPPPLGDSFMVYDSESDRVILYGGSDTHRGEINTTWAFDNNSNTWIEMAEGPSARMGHSMAYDAESDRVILFSGADYVDNAMTDDKYQDTWAYDFNSDTWESMKPTISPQGRIHYQMTYNSVADKVVVWGGVVGANSTDQSLWTYDYNANSWEENTFDGGPGTRANSEIIYDAESDRIILFGSSINETWAYDLAKNSWESMEPEGSPGRLSFHSMVYSDKSDQLVLFGGGLLYDKAKNNTWVYDHNTNNLWNVTPSEQ